MRIGDNVSFIPTAFINSEYPGCHAKYKHDYPVTVTGTVCGTNIAHRWYRVKFYVHGTELHECFKF